MKRTGRPRSRPPCVLTIAGSDSGAGAGVQADARTIHALGGFALTALTAVTAQNTCGIRAWAPVAPRLVRAQIEAVTGDFAVAAVKTGLLPGAAAIRAVAQTLARHPTVPLVVDPVLGATRGPRFLSPAALAALRAHLLPRATIVTPNWSEAAALSGRTLATFADAAAAGRALAADWGCAVLVKGGHGPGNICRDCLVLPDGGTRWFSAPRLATPNTHGTGCVLSAALATALARGAPLGRAVALAHAFLQRQLRQGRRRRWGAGAGPAFAGVITRGA